jgi:hypothetical protein
MLSVLICVFILFLNDYILQVRSGKVDIHGLEKDSAKMDNAREGLGGRLQSIRGHLWGR